MSSAQSLREFIRERLTAAAAEIFSEFEQTIVRYEEEIDRQRRLLEISWKPQINLHRIELPLHYGRRDGRFLTDQQLWDKENCSLDQDQPEPLQEGSEPPQMKVEQDDPELLQVLEQEELCISQDVEQFVLKQETVTSLVTPADVQSDHHEPEPDRHQLLSSLSPAAEIQNQEGRIHHFKLPQHHVWEKEKVLSDQQFSNQETTATLDQKEPEPPPIKEEQQEICIHQQEGQFILKEENLTSLVISPSGDTDCCEPEPNRNQPLCQSSTEAGNQDQDGCRNEKAESNSNEELTQNKSRQQTEDHRDCVDGQKLNKHKRAHRGNKLFSCKICGKSYSYNCELTVHMIAHTGKKPFTCLTCGKCFSQVGTLNYHTRAHTGEKPFKCLTCGKCFSRSSILTAHMRSHTGEKPFKCETCCKGFSRSSNLTTHMRTHTGEKPFKCKTCGKCFTRSGTLTDHIRTHTGEKPFSCKVCSKSFACRNHLTRHIRIHKSKKPFT